MSGLGGLDIAPRFLLKLIVSESRFEHWVAGAERLNEADSVSRHVSIQTWSEILVLSIVKLRFDAPAVPQDAILEGPLQFSESH
jgi:hypothetical protein